MSLVGNFGVLFARLAIGYDFVWCIVPFGHMIMWKSGLRKILLYKKTQQIQGLQRYQNPAIEVLKIFFQLVYASISLHPLSLVWTICMVHTNLPCSVSTFYFRFRSWIYYYCHANWTSDLKLESIGAAAATHFVYMYAYHLIRNDWKYWYILGLGLLDNAKPKFFELTRYCIFKIVVIDLLYSIFFIATRWYILLGVVLIKSQAQSLGMPTFKLLFLKRVYYFVYLGKHLCCLPSRTEYGCRQTDVV